jgi:hypothetical protein
MIQSTAILTEIKAKLEQNRLFFAEPEIYNQKSLVGYDKQFRLQWFATQLNTFISVTAFDEEDLVTEFLVREYAEDVYNYALMNNRGWKPGFQSGVVAIPVVIVKKAAIDARVFCEKPKKAKKWGGFMMPIVIERISGDVFYVQERPFVGRLYYTYLKKLMDTMVAEPTAKAFEKFRNSK